MGSNLPALLSVLQAAVLQDSQDRRHEKHQQLTAILEINASRDENSTSCPGLTGKWGERYQMISKITYRSEGVGKKTTAVLVALNDHRSYSLEKFDGDGKP